MAPRLGFLCPARQSACRPCAFATALVRDGSTSTSRQARKQEPRSKAGKARAGQNGGGRRLAHRRRPHRLNDLAHVEKVEGACGEMRQARHREHARHLVRHAAQAPRQACKRCRCRPPRRTRRRV